MNTSFSKRLEKVEQGVRKLTAAREKQIDDLAALARCLGLPELSRKQLGALVDQVFSADYVDPWPDLTDLCEMIMRIIPGATYEQAAVKMKEVEMILCAH